MKKEALSQSAEGQKTVNSFNCEFGYELIAVIPYAYNLMKRGLLKKTISGPGSEPFYYFSPEHEVSGGRRSWYWKETTAVEMMHQAGIPNAFIHRRELNTDEWTPPPYKKIYHKAVDAMFRDPLFVIYNRYNNEWPATINKPINYFSLDLLGEAFRILTMAGYHVLYVNVHGQEDLYDNAPPLDLGDYDFCKRYRNVTHIKDLMATTGLSFNQAQLTYYPHVERFLTMNGGGSILASYFGGQNIIYTKYCRELQCGDFEYYHLLGGSRIDVVSTYDDILKLL